MSEEESVKPTLRIVLRPRRRRVEDWDEQSLMALPEVTELDYVVWEWLDDRWPEETKFSPPITFQVEVKDFPEVGGNLTDFMNDGKLQDSLNSRYIGLDDLRGFVRESEMYWVWRQPPEEGDYYLPCPIFRISHRNLFSLLESLEDLRDATLATR